MAGLESWVMLTPHGALKAFASAQPDARALALQALLSGTAALDADHWHALAPLASGLQEAALADGDIQLLKRAMQGPDTRLDDFVPHVIASLSGERRAVLASDSGFCLGRAGMPQDESDALAAAAADFADFAKRQARRGWSGASHYVSFSADPQLLLPDVSFVPFWVDGAGYWLILGGEPLLNNPALVELLWGIKEAGMRFQSQRG